MKGDGKMKRQGSGWKGESRRHSLARKGVKTVLPDGRRFDVSNFVARGVERKWQKILDVLEIPEENIEVFGDDIDIDFTSDEFGQYFTFWITIENPLVTMYGEDIPEDALEKTNAFFRKEYPNMDYDDYHLKFEDYITFSNTNLIDDDEVKKGYKIINDKDRLQKWLENLTVDKFYETDAKRFREDWTIFYHGKNK